MCAQGKPSLGIFYGMEITKMKEFYKLDTLLISNKTFEPETSRKNA